MASGSEREVIIRVADLKAAYDGQVVLDHINFEVYAGEVLAILGGSGSGKSTLLKHMIGLYQPAAGKVLIDGEDIAAASGAARLKILRKFGVMYQSGALFGSMTLLLCLDELSAGLDPVTSAELDQLVLSLARSLKITFIVVTHELPSIFTIADRVIMLDKQEKGIVAVGSPQELRDHSDDPRVHQFFFRQASSEN